MRLLKKIGFSLLVFLILFLVWFKINYGSIGEKFPDLSTKPVLTNEEAKLEIVATLPEPPGNIAVSEQGRIFFNYHPEGRPEVKVMELVNGKPVPFPNEEFQKDRSGKPFYDHVFALRIDTKNRLWSLDTGFHGIKGAKLLAVDINTKELVHEYTIPSEIAGIGSYCQDFQIDTKSEKIYIADIGVMAKKPAILIYDISSKTIRRVLSRDKSVLDVNYVIDSKGKKMILLGGLYSMHPAIDSISLDRKDEWLYYGAMSHKNMFRIKTSDLNDTSLSAEELSKRVEVYGPKVQSDGTTMDEEGNIYITGIEDGSIYRLNTDRKLETFIKDSRFRWPDGIGYGEDGWIYFTDSDIPDMMMKSKSHMIANSPYYIFRFKSGTKARAGQ
jgi:sugar lactone lactonase YvrE